MKIRGKQIILVAGLVLLAASAWAGPAEKNVAVYMTLYAHLERDSNLASYADASQDNYRQIEAGIISFANNCEAMGVTLDFGVDANWVLDENKWGDKSLTKGESLWAYLDKLPRISVEPHAHEHTSANDGKYYNLADVEYLLLQDGVPDHGIVNGLGSDGSSYTEFFQPQQGNVYPSFFWQPIAIFGVPSPGHEHDVLSSGIWHPSSTDAYTVGDSRLIIIGGGRDTASGEADILLSGNYDLTKMNTAMIQPGANDAAFLPGDNSLEDLLRSASSLKSTYGSQIYWANLPEMINIWEAYYGGVSSLTF